MAGPDPTPMYGACQKSRDISTIVVHSLIYAVVKSDSPYHSQIIASTIIKVAFMTGCWFTFQYMHGYTCDCHVTVPGITGHSAQISDIEILIHSSIHTPPHLPPLMPPHPPPPHPPSLTSLLHSLHPSLLHFLHPSLLHFLHPSLLHPHSTMHFLHQSLLHLLHILHPHSSIPLSSTSSTPQSSTCSTPHSSLLHFLHILPPQSSTYSTPQSSTCSTPHSSLLHFLHPSLLHAPSGCGQGHCEAPEGFWEAGPPRNTQP